ncbi:MAG: SUMF1/EgtB/PvdO family nonheme iron enzyme [Sedimenticola sp.]
MIDNSNDNQANNGSVASGSVNNSTIQIINNHGGSMTGEEAKQHEQQYLKRLMKDCTSLEWLRLVRKQDEDTPAIDLESIYTALMTESLVNDPEAKPGIQNLNQLSALDMLNHKKKLVLTGDPGSGKSVFVNYLALCMSGAKLKNKIINLSCLTEPLLDEEGEPQSEIIVVNNKEQQQEVRQRWDHGSLIPLRIILRDFSSSTVFPSDDEIADVRHLMKFIREDLQNKELEPYYEVLKGHLQAGEVLIMLDGLDEVEQIGRRRTRLLDCIEGLAKSYSDCRFLVTCRTYAYPREQRQLLGFSETKLANFKRGQIIHFVKRWYRHLSGFYSDASQSRASKLQKAILARPSLFELANRPLLLSLISYLHANRHELPDRRATLYERLLELLIDDWEKARFKIEDAEAAFHREQYSLVEFLEIGHDAIRLVLQRLAFMAQYRQDSKSNGTADISSKDLIYELSCVARKKGKQISEWELAKYLCDRVGILYQRGGVSEENAIYTFPHRSFQEFLAADYFRREEDRMFDFFKNAEFVQDDSWQEIAAYLGRSDPDRWREVIVLAGGINAQKDPGPIWDLVEKLIYSEGDESNQFLAWGLRLAGEITAESLKFENLNRKHRKIFEELQSKLKNILGSEQLPAIERATIGRYLSIIGDPRKEIMTVDEMHFCLIPSGTFLHSRNIKEEDHYDIPRTEIDIPYNYWISRFPVTVAQFKIFISENEYTLKNPKALRGFENHPICRINFKEASDFCRWVTKKWQESGLLDDDKIVMIPSELEWVKAAVGGLKVPVGSEIQLAKYLQNNAELRGNVLPNRIYPWGKSANPDNANYSATGIKSTSTVGCFPKGVSPYGVEDLCGNVWEWVSLDHSDSPNRGIHGGSFHTTSRYIKNYIQEERHPVQEHGYLGFRIAIVPTFKNYGL